VLRVLGRFLEGEFAFLILCYFARFHYQGRHIRRRSFKRIAVAVRCVEPTSHESFLRGYPISFPRTLAPRPISPFARSSLSCHFTTEALSASLNTFSSCGLPDGSRSLPPPTLFSTQIVRRLSFSDRGQLPFLLHFSPRSHFFLF